MPLDQLRQSIDPRIGPIQLMVHHPENAVCDLGHFQLFFYAVLSRELRHSLDTRRQDMFKLLEYASGRIHDLSTLSNDQISRPVNFQDRLSIFGLYLNEAPLRAVHGFTNRLGISGIRLPALHSRLDVSSRHDPNVTSQLAQLTAPMMRRSASFHANYTPRKCFEEREQLGPLDFLVNDPTACRRNAVNLRNVLGHSSS